MRPSFHSRRGVTLVEIAIVIAIIGVLAGVGAGLLTDMIPAWRTRQAAIEFQTHVNQARTLSIADGTEYRIVFDEMDDDVSGDGPNVGTYRVEKGDASSSSTAWDTLPVEMSSDKVLDGEGYVNIADGGQDSLPQVSIVAFDTDLVADGQTDNVNAILFSPRGTVSNSPEDFACDVAGSAGSDGYLCVTFANKRKAQEGADDSWTVIISRAGMSRLLHSDASTVGHSAGIGSSSSSSGAINPQGYVGPNDAGGGDDSGVVALPI